MSMKLNNFGFGMRDMIIYMCILLIFLLFAVYSIDSFHKSFESSDESKNNSYVQKNEEEKEQEEEKINDVIDYEYYNNLEISLKNATLNYINDYSFDLKNDIEKVSLNTLVDLGYMQAVVDQYGNATCYGYSNVYQDDNLEYVVYSYIMCDNYVTEGY